MGCSTSIIIFNHLDTYFNQVTPGNDGKWGSVESTQGSYNWGNLDAIYNYALSKGFPFKEHTLVWGNQQPGWITTLDSAHQRVAVENWINLVCQRYPQMSFVDVVNEPFSAPAGYSAALGGAGTTGWDWIVTAFTWARHYSTPGVKLLLNEYNILHDNTRTNQYIRLIDTLMVRGLIDGIGIQGHYFEFRSEIATNSYVYSVSTIKNNLDRLAAIGLPIYITEFDIDEPIDSNQLSQYKIYFPLFWTHPAVKGMTLWGYIAYDIWTSHPYTYILHYDGTERPAAQWLRTYVVCPIPPVLISPLGTTNAPRNPILVWHSSYSATAYHLQVANNNAFGSPIMDALFADTLLQFSHLDSNTTYYWRVNAANGHGEGEYSATTSFTTGNQIVSVEKRTGMPTEFTLAQNYPNPVNPSTTIKFILPEARYVQLKIINILGQVVKEIVVGNCSAGTHSISVDASNLASGIYFYRLQAGTYTAVKQMVLLK